MTPMKNVKYLIGSENIYNKPLPPFDDAVCAFLAQLSDNLLNSPTIRTFPDIAALGFWIRKGNIQKLKSRYKNSCRLGRGLAFHVAPANIPLNFAFSYIFSLLAGNANIVRAPSKPFLQTMIVCDILRQLLPDFPSIQKRTAFINYPANDEITAQFCAMTDVRIIWGGDQTVSHIRHFPIKPRCVDVVFADRYSFCVINAHALLESSEKELEQLAKLFYNDTYLMDQNACSSPQIIFWQNKNKEAQSRFWQAVKNYASQHYQLQPALAIDKYVQVCKDAITFENLSALHCDGVLYRIQFSSLPNVDLTELRGKGGCFYECNLEDFSELTPFITEKYQTVTYYGVKAETIQTWVTENHLRGIDRIVPIGSAMDIGLIWDGYNLIDILSREINAG